MSSNRALRRELSAHSLGRRFPRHECGALLDLLLLRSHSGIPSYGLDIVFFLPISLLPALSCWSLPQRAKSMEIHSIDLQVQECHVCTGMNLPAPPKAAPTPLKSK